MNIGPTEIIVVLIIALLVFGPKRLPQMGKSLGKGVREFKKAADTAKTELGLGEVTSQINDVKATFTEPLKEVTGTFTDLKSSVDVKSAIEAPLPDKAAAAAGAAAGTAATAGLAGATESTPEPPAAAPGPETPAVAPEPETPVDAPTAVGAEPAASAVTPVAPEGTATAGGPSTGA